MRYGIIGNGDVAHCIATKLRELGHEVVLGSRKGTTFNDIMFSVVRLQFPFYVADKKGETYIFESI